MRRECTCVLALTATAIMARAQPAEDWLHVTRDAQAAERAGDYPRALALYRDSARLADAFPAGDARRIWAWNTLGMMCDNLGNFTDAEAAYRRALAAIPDGGGRTGIARATVLANLALVKIETGRAAPAEDLLREAIALDEAEDPPSPLRLALARNSLAEFLIVANRHGEAEPLLIAALPDLTDVDKSTALGNLATIRLAQGRGREAQKALDEALAILETSRGPRHPVLLRTLNNLATAQYRNGDTAGAAQTFHRALDLAVDTLGSEHPLYGQVLENYAAFLRQTGDKGRGRDLAARATRILRDTARRNGIGTTIDVSALR